MEQIKDISEEELKADIFLKNIVTKEIPNEKPSIDFTQKVLKQVAVLPMHIKKAPWYQSLNFWLILSSIAFVFTAGFGLLFYICNFSIMQTFSVIINYLNKFEFEIPIDSILSSFNITNTMIIVIASLGIFVLIDFAPSFLIKRQRKKTNY